MKIKILILFILGLYSSLAKACECDPITSQNSFVQKSYNNSKIVFLGVVESISNETIVFNLTEILKGEYNKSTIIVSNRDSCSITPKKDEMWLIYLEKKGDNNEYLTSICLPNRNFGVINFLEKVPPPMNENEYLNYSFERHREILINSELNSLRQKKILNEINIIKENFVFIKYFLLLVGVLLILSMLIKRKK